MADAHEWGAPPEFIAALEARQDDDDFAVWPENWETLCAFLAVCTQWRTAPLGGGMQGLALYWLGLDYAGVEAGLRGAGIAATPDLWAGLRVMEAAARNALNGQKAAD